jgi:hypothetical protein
VNHRHRISGPYIKTVLPDGTGDGIFVCGCGKEHLKIELSDTGQAGSVEPWRFSYYPWQGPARRVRFGAPDIAACAFVPQEVHRQVASETSGLAMGSPHEFSQHHCSAADSRAKRDHDYILHALGCPAILFTKQGHSSIIFNSKAKAEVLHCPLLEIEMHRILVFFSVERMRPLRTSTTPGNPTATP